MKLLFLDVAGISASTEITTKEQFNNLDFEELGCYSFRLLNNGHDDLFYYAVNKLLKMKFPISEIEKNFITFEENL